MPISKSDIIQVCKTLAENERIRVATGASKTIESAKGGAYAATGATLGGLVRGGLGMLAGSLIGGAFGFFTTQGEFKSAVDVIANELSPEQQTKLVNSVNKIIGNVGASDAAALIKTLNADEKMKKAVIQAIIDFLTQEMGLTVEG